MRYGEVSSSSVDVPVGVSVRVGEYHATFGVRPIVLIASAAFPPSEIASVAQAQGVGDQSTETARVGALGVGVVPAVVGEAQLPSVGWTG